MRLISALAPSGDLRGVACGALLALGLLGAPGRESQALTINATFDNTLSSDAHDAINTAISVFMGLISDPVTVNIYFQSGSIGGLGTNSVGLFPEYYNNANPSPFSNVRGLLAADATANPSNTILTTAVANLPTGSTALNGRPFLYMTAANLRALGLSASYCYNAAGSYVGCGAATAVNDSVITLANSGVLDYTRPITSGKYDALRVIEHEIDEVLGVGGAGSMLGTAYTANYSGILDLYRYSAPGVASFTTASNATAYYSINGGVTSLIGANQSSTGDYADFASLSGCPQFVQNAFACTDQIADVSRNSPEGVLLQAVGWEFYALASVPEPATMTVLAIAMAALPVARRRRNI